MNNINPLYLQEDVKTGLINTLGAFKKNGLTQGIATAKKQLMAVNRANAAMRKSNFLHKTGSEMEASNATQRVKNLGTNLRRAEAGRMDKIQGIKDKI